MIHKAWCYLGEVPFCISRSSIKFQGHTAPKMVDFDTQIVTPIWIHQWIQNHTQSIIEEVSYSRFFKVNHWILRSHIGAFPDCNSSLNSLMAMKWCTKLEEAEKRCPIVFQGYPSNLKVTWDKKITDFDPNRVFLDCTSKLNSPMTLKWCTKLDVV